MYYHIAGYFRGVLIFVIFVVNLRVTKFSTHEYFHHVTCMYVAAYVYALCVLTYVRVHVERLY